MDAVDKTAALCAIHGPLEPRQHTTTSHLVVRVITASGTLTSPATTSLASHLRQIFANVIHLPFQPRSEIQVAVTLESDLAEFALMASSVNATMLALMDAGVACTKTVAAVCIGINKKGAVVLDPGAEEAKVCVEIAVKWFGMLC